MKVAVIIVQFLCIIHLLNPPLNEHQSEVRNSVTKALGVNTLPLDAALWAVSKETVTIKDYYFFSFTYFKGNKVGVGVLGNVILYGNVTAIL